MMLFLLITIVNIGYYAQFKYKVSYSASTVAKAPIQPEEQTKVQQKCKPQPSITKEEKDILSFHKVKPILEINSTKSLFSGGKAEGNAVKYAPQKRDPEAVKQILIAKDLQLAITFSSTQVFLNSQTKRKVKLFINTIRRRSKKAEFTIYAADPRKIISSTIAKQISLGRVLNIQALIKQSRIPKEQISFNLKNELPTSSDFGEILIKVHIP